MNIYLLIVAIGLLLKLWVSYYALSRERMNYDSKLNNIIFLSAAVIVTFSIPQFFLLADGTLATPFNLPRYLILRWYIFHGLVCITLGVYFILVVFYPSVLAQKLTRIVLKLVGLSIVLIGARIILFSDFAIDASMVTKQNIELELGRGSGDAFFVFTRALVAAIFIYLFFSFLKKYKSATNHQSQIINLYAVIALFCSVIECIAIVFVVDPLLFAIKGIFFTIVIFLACSDREIYDARPVALITLEARTRREMQRIFHDYANNRLTHKTAMQDIEKAMVNYKLNKVGGFRDAKGSPLPEVAENMDVKLSTLYELIKRLNLRRPKA